MANRYWVGGTGNWDSSTTTHWSATNGGAGGASVPGVGDTANFTSSSNATTYTVTLTAGASFGPLNLAGPASGTLNFNTNGQAMTTGNWSQSAGTVAISLGASVISVLSSRSASSAIINLSTATIDGGTSAITVTYNSSTNTIDFGAASVTLYDITLNDNFNSGSRRPVRANIFNCHNFTYVNGTNSPYTKYLDWQITTFDASGTLTLTGFNATNKRIFCAARPYNGVSTVTAAATSLTNVDFKNITVSGSTFSGTSVGDCGGNTNITGATPVTRYWIGDAGSFSDTAHWSTSSGGAGGASVPIPQDTIIFDANSIISASQTVTVDTYYLGTSCTFATVDIAFTLTLASTDKYLFGNLTMNSLVTVGGGVIIQCSPASTATITSSGGTLRYLSTFLATGIITLADTLTLNGYFELYNGTFDTNNQNISTPAIYAWNYVPATLTLGSSTITLTGTGDVADIEVSPGYFENFNAGTSTFVISNTSATSKTFFAYQDGMALSLYNLTVTGDNVIINGLPVSAEVMSINTLALNNGGSANGTKIKNGTSLSLANMTTTASAGNLAILNSDTTGTHTLIKAGGGRVSVDYLNIQHSVATPASTWYAGANSTNNQADATAGSGWVFTDAPPNSGFLSMM